MKPSLAVFLAFLILVIATLSYGETRTDKLNLGRNGSYPGNVVLEVDGSTRMTFKDIQNPVPLTLTDLASGAFGPGNLNYYLPGIYHEILEIGVPGNTWQRTSSPTFTGLTIPTGAVTNHVWTSNAVGVGSWQPVASSSFPVMANGNLLIGDGDNTPIVNPLTGTTNQVTVTNGAGTITLSLPQNIHTAADPQFASLSLSKNASGLLTLNNTNPTGNVTLDFFQNMVLAGMIKYTDGIGFSVDVADPSEVGFVVEENGVAIAAINGDPGVSTSFNLADDTEPAVMTAQLYSTGVTHLSSAGVTSNGFQYLNRVSIGTDPVNDADFLSVNEWDLGSAGRFESLVDDAGQMATHHRVLEVGANSGDVGIPLPASDGFGPRVVFTLKDDDLVKNTIASIDAKRNGADNTGRMMLTVNVAGLRTVIADLDATDVDLSVPLTADLNGATGNGLIARVGAETFENRTLTAGTGIAVTNGDGVAGNPTVALNMDNVIITQTADTSTGSASYVQMAGMTHTVGSAGTYLFTFSASGNVSGTGNNAEYAFHFGAGPTIQQYTERNLNFGGGAAAADFDCAMHAQLLRVMTVGENVQVMYRTSGGTFTAHERTIMVMKLSD